MNGFGLKNSKVKSQGLTPDVLKVSNCDVNELVNIYDNYYGWFLNTNFQYRAWGCGLTFNVISLHSVTCEQWAQILFNGFKTAFCNTQGNQCSQCENCTNSWCNKSLCTKTMVVEYRSALYNEPMSNLGWLGSHMGTSSHIWVEVGFQSCDTSKPRVWRNYDPWTDSCHNILFPRGYPDIPYPY